MFTDAPNANRLELMFWVSFKACPAVAPDLPTRSEPARSTRLSFPRTVAPPLARLVVVT